MTEEVDFSKYSVQDLAFYSLYGSLGDSEISRIGNVEQIGERIRTYVQEQPEEFRTEFRIEVDSHLEDMANKKDL